MDVNYDLFSRKVKSDVVRVVVKTLDCESGGCESEYG